MHRITSIGTGKRMNRRVMLALAVSASLGATQVMAASANWSGGNGTLWSTDGVGGNWGGVTAPGNLSGAASTTTDDATFNTATNLQVDPDLGRAIRKTFFGASAGAFTIGPASGANKLYVRGDITGANTSKITFNSPVETTSDMGISPAANQTFDFNAVFVGKQGLSVYPRGGTNSVINMNAGLASSVSTNGTNFRNWLSGTTMNVKASTSVGWVNIYDVSGTLNLDATNIINTSGSASAFLGITTGTANVNAADAVKGTARLEIGGTSSGTPTVTIKHDQSYTGRLTLPIAVNTNANKRTAGTGNGTVLGNFTYYDPDGSTTEYPSLAIIGQNGYTVSAAATGNGTLWVNNNSANSGASHTLGGSATGNSDVNIVTGTLAGNGYIANSDVTISIPAIGATPAHDQVFAQGVTLHKRQQVTGIANGTNYNDYYNGATPATLASYGLTASGAATYGKLSPGASAGAIGTLTMDLGSKGLNIAYAVQDTNTQTLLFDLGAPAASDKVSLLDDTTLHIGTGGLEFDDFVFTVQPGFIQATYTLFSSASSAIDGTLGSNISGTVGGYSASLALANGGKDLVLVVPEPASLGLLAIGALGLLGRRRRAN